MAVKNDNIAVTGALLSFTLALQAAKQLFIHEGLMDKGLGLATTDWHTRCKHLFEVTYGERADMIGLKRNLITFETLLNLRLSGEIMDTLEDDLPTRFVFNPWHGIRSTVATLAND